MKKYWILIAFLCIAGITQAQKDAISTLFSSYENDENVTKVSISSKMFQLFTHIEGETKEEQELMETISKLTGLKILAKDTPDGKKLYREALRIPGREYEELMTVEDQDEDLTFFIREESGKISELLMLAGGIDNFVILSLVGDIDLSQVAKLSKSMDLGGMEYLENIKER